jgi:phospholipid/cholesterol/gamma-HCH transport system substrate-binding protein
MITRSQRVRLNLFIVLGLSLIVVFVVLVIGRRLLQRRQIYHIRFHDVAVSGLNLGSVVQFRGIDVGNVEDLALDPEDVQSVIATVSIRAGTPMKRGMEAVLVPVGITGLMRIELIGATNEAEVLPPRSTIPGRSSAIDRILGPAENIATQLEQVLTSLSAVFDKQNRERFASILVQLDAVLGENRNEIDAIFDGLEAIVSENRKPLKETVDNLRVATARLGRTSAAAETLVAGLSGDIEEADVASVIADLRQLIEQIETTVAGVDLVVMQNREDVAESVESLRDAIEDLSEFAALIRDEPSLLLRSRRR